MDSKTRIFFIFLGIAIAVLGIGSLFSRKEAEAFSVSIIAQGVQRPGPPFVCPELDRIVRCPLHYIGHGMQAIAFASADEKYVLKFFLKRPFHTKKRFFSFRNLIPFASRAKEAEKARLHEAALRHALDRYELAFEAFKEETGLIAVHLGKSRQALPFCVVLDARGKEHRVDLDAASFVVQRCAAPAGQAFAQRTGEERERAWLLLEELLEVRAKKGFTDLRRGFHPGNFGFLEDKAIMLDPGRLVFSEEVQRHPDQETERLKDLIHRKLN